MTAVVGNLEIELAPRPDDLRVVRDGLREFTDFHAGPVAVVFLDTLRRLRGDSVASKAFQVAVIPADSNVAQRARSSGWGLDSADAGLVHLWIGDGFTGLAFRLRQEGDTVRGDVRGYADIPHLLPPLRHAVRAVRVACLQNATG